AEFVGELCIGIEIASSPLATLNDLGPGAVVSDFGNNWGVVVGTAVDDWRGLYEVTAQTFIDDEFVGRGVAEGRPGAPRALAFTLGKAARRGRPLQAGAVISTGMITGVHDIRPGQRSLHVFQGVGGVGCRAGQALAPRLTGMGGSRLPRGACDMPMNRRDALIGLGALCAAHSRTASAL